MTWLAMFLALEAGMMREMVNDYQLDWAFYTDMEIGALVLDHLELKTDIRSFQDFSGEGVYFNPFRIDYTIVAVVLIGPISIGAEHYCSHPVVSPRRQMLGYYADGDRLFVRFER